MKATTTVLSEASALEAATDKCFARYEKKRDALLARHRVALDKSATRIGEAHNVKMAKLTDDWHAERDAIRDNYSDEAVALFNRLQSEKAKATEGKAS